MRQAVAGLLVVFTLAIGSPMVGASPSDATVLGQLVNAGGRGETGQSVELVRDGVVVATTVTMADGEFIFGGIAPGTYIVRTMMNNRAAGVRVSVNAGESRPVTVVLPSLATASPIVAGGISLFTSALLSGGTVVTNTVFTNAIAKNDLQFVTEVNNDFGLISNFIQQIQGQFATNSVNGAAEFIARNFHVGPYSTQ